MGTVMSAEGRVVWRCKVTCLDDVRATAVTADGSGGYFRLKSMTSAMIHTAVKHMGVVCVTRRWPGGWGEGKHLLDAPGSSIRLWSVCSARGLDKPSVSCGPPLTPQGAGGLRHWDRGGSVGLSNPTSGQPVDSLEMSKVYLDVWTELCPRKRVC